MACGKICYLNRKQAKKSLKEINRQLKKRGEEIILKDVYLCNECLYWHTTSIPKIRSRDLTRHYKNLKNKTNDKPSDKGKKA